MARIQDLRELEDSICDAVSEFLDNEDAYSIPVVYVYLDEDDMRYKAIADDADRYTNGEELYPIETLIRTNDDGSREPDMDSIGDVASSWIFVR